jgi:hypothetical protein
VDKWTNGTKEFSPPCRVTVRGQSEIEPRRWVVRQGSMQVDGECSEPLSERDVYRRPTDGTPASRGCAGARLFDGGDVRHASSDRWVRQGASARTCVAAITWGEYCEQRTGMKIVRFLGGLDLPRGTAVTICLWVPNAAAVCWRICASGLVCYLAESKFFFQKFGIDKKEWVRGRSFGDWEVASRASGGCRYGSERVSLWE